MNKYTDQEFTYRETPVSYDGIAKLDSIKGNTVAWNQLAPTLASGNYTANRSTITYSNNVATVTTNGNDGFGFYRSMATVVGHKYLFTARVKPSKVGSLRLGLDEDGTVTNRIAFSSASEKTVGRTWTCATANSPLVCYYYNNAIASGDNFTITNLMVIDLTLLADFNITDLASFKTYYPLSYYSFNQGTLVNFSGNGIKTVGKNQLNAEDVGTGASGVTFTANVGSFRQVYSGTSVYIDARFYASSPYANGHFLPTKYTLSFDISGVPSGQTWLYGLRGTNNAFLSGGQRGTINGDGHYSLTVDFDNVVDCSISFCRTTGATPFDITVSNLQFELGTTETEYEPYTETITDLPISTYFPTGLKSAGTVYDELTPSKAITRVGSVKLGDLNWSVANGGADPSKKRMYSNGLENIAKGTTVGTIPPNLLCTKYNAITTNQSYADSAIGMTFGITGLIYVNDPDYESATDATAFKQMLTDQNVVFNYELATPTEADATDIFFKFYGDGTEEILPTNGSTPTTTPFFGDITYYNTFEGEVPYRKFWMVNSKGERWNLTEREVKSFLNNPQGLGFSKTINTTRYGNAQVLTDITDNFPSPSGEVLFYDSHNSTRYEQYNEFVKFLSYEPVTLYYKLPFSFYSQIPNVYTLECVVGTLTKTESKNDNLMTCPITFNALSYYKGDEVNITGTGTSYTITNDGDFPVGFEITLEGGLTNPYITLEQDGDLYGEAKFDDETAFSSVYVNSNDGEQNVVLEQGGSILPNPLSYQDLSISNGSIYVTFVKLARGESTLTIGMDSGSLTRVSIKFVPIYRSV